MRGVAFIIVMMFSQWCFASATYSSWITAQFNRTQLTIPRFPSRTAIVNPMTPILAPSLAPSYGYPNYPSYGVPNYSVYGAYRGGPLPFQLPPAAYRPMPYLMPQPNPGPNPMMLMMLPALMSGMGGGGGFSPGGHGYTGTVSPVTPGDYVPPSGRGIRPGYTGPAKSRYNDAGDLGVDTSQVNTSELSTTNCAQPHDSFQCLVCNCYWEAGNEPYPGKVEVNRVVITRLKNKKHFHDNNLCQVVYQPYQFSWTNGYRGRKVMQSQNTIKQCMVASKDALKQGADGYDHYHAYYVSPSWRRSMRFMTRIGSHLFYSQDSLSYADHPTGGDADSATAAN